MPRELSGKDCHFLATQARFTGMRLSSFRLQILALGLVLAFCALGAGQASARSQKHHFDSLTVPSIPVDATGTPVIMQGLERPAKAVITGVKKQNAPFISRAAAPASFRRALQAFRERLCWARRWLSPLTTRPPSTASATASSNPTKRFHSTAASATIPATATPTYATTSAADRGRSTLARRNHAEEGLLGSCQILHENSR
jgi:hypothetical protein